MLVDEAGAVRVVIVDPTPVEPSRMSFGFVFSCPFGCGSWHDATSARPTFADALEDHLAWESGGELERVDGSQVKRWRPVLWKNIQLPLFGEK